MTDGGIQCLFCVWICSQTFHQKHHCYKAFRRSDWKASTSRQHFYSGIKRTRCKRQARFRTWIIYASRSTNASCFDSCPIQQNWASQHSQRNIHPFYCIAPFHHSVILFAFSSLGRQSAAYVSRISETSWPERTLCQDAISQKACFNWLPTEYWQKFPKSLVFFSIWRLSLRWALDASHFMFIGV